jgi:hypothetical protein
MICTQCPFPLSLATLGAVTLPAGFILHIFKREYTNMRIKTNPIHFMSALLSISLFTFVSFCFFGKKKKILAYKQAHFIQTGVIFFQYKYDKTVHP